MQFGTKNLVRYVTRRLTILWVNQRDHHHVASAVHKVEGKPECFQLCTYEWRGQEILEVDVFYEETRIRTKEHMASITHTGVSMRGVIYLDGDQLINHVGMSLSKESSWYASSWCTGHEDMKAKMNNQNVEVTYYQNIGVTYESQCDNIDERYHLRRALGRYCFRMSSMMSSDERDTDDFETDGDVEEVENGDERGPYEFAENSRVVNGSRDEETLLVWHQRVTMLQQAETSGGAESMLIDGTFRVYTDDDILEQWPSWEMNWLHAWKLFDRLGGPVSMSSGVMDMRFGVWMCWYIMYLVNKWAVWMLLARSFIKDVSFFTFGTIHSAAGDAKTYTITWLMR